VHELDVRSKWKLRPFETIRNARDCDIVFGWFSSWHMVLPVFLAKLFKKPVVIVTGGYDTANLQEIGYGNQRKWFSRFVTNWNLKKADLLICNSDFTKNEVIGINHGFQNKIRVIYHGIPAKQFNPKPKENIVLNVGNVSRENMHRKGIKPFAEAAVLMPEYRFLQAGRWIDDSIQTLKQNAPNNLEFLGYVTDQDLTALYQKSKIYLQPSLHEGFGMSVAEAMMAGCIPVVTAIGALPEVTGKFGLVIKSLSVDGILEAIKSLADYPYTPNEISDHIGQNFTIARRKELLNQCLNSL
jgi:glycosyltransferase involved in cell wall biosynthesis